MLKFMKHNKVIITLIFLLPFVILLASCSQKSLLEKTSKDENQIEDKNISYSEVDEDLNNDGIKEKISLIYKSGLFLKIDNVEKNMDQVIEFKDYLEQKPTIQILNTLKGKIVLITMIWKTNNIGSTAQYWLYDYSNNILNNIYSPGQKTQIVKYELQKINNEYVLKLPELNISKKFNAVSGFQNIESEGTLEFSPDIMVYANDYNNDGFFEIATQRRISSGAVDWLPFDHFTTISRIEGVNDIPIKHIPNGSTQLDNTVIDFISENRVLNNENRIDLTDYIGEEDVGLKSVLSGLVNEKFLVKDGENYYFNLN